MYPGPARARFRAPAGGQRVSRRPREEVGIADGFAGGAISLDWSTRDSNRLKSATRRMRPVGVGVAATADITLPNQRRQRLFRLHQGGRAVFLE